MAPISSSLSFFSFSFSEGQGEEKGRAKGDGPKVTEPNLQCHAVFCGNLLFSAVSCALQMLEFPGEGVNLRKSAVFCDQSAFWALSVTLVPCP